MNKIDLLYYLQDNPDNLIDLLGRIGFEKIKIDYKGYIRCALPDGENGQAVAIDIKTTESKPLYSRIYSRNYEGDFYGLIGYITTWKFSKVLQKCHEYLGLKYEGYYKCVNSKPKGNYTIETQSYTKPVANNKKSDIENKEYDISILDEYLRLPHVDFTNEGIVPQTQVKYCICYSGLDERILIPHFKWRDKTKIVGIQARTTVPNASRYLIPKYTNLIEGFKKSQNLYGLSHNIKDINETKQIIILEGEKSVMKLDSFTQLHSFGVALGGSSISDFQVDLIGKLSRRIEGLEVIVALDKDVPLYEVLEMCEKLQLIGCNRISYIIDNKNLLGGKDSFVDKGYKVYLELFENRVIYNEKDS